MTIHTLFAAPFTCSLAPHLVLRQHGIPHHVRWVRRGPGRNIQDLDFAKLNPKRKVPALVLPEGTTVTENIAVLTVLDRLSTPSRPEADRTRMLEWLSFLSTELHKTVLVLAFDPQMPEVAVQDAHDRLLSPILAHLDARLTVAPTLLGGTTPTGADALLLWALLLLTNRWPDLQLPPALLASRNRMLALDHVRTTLAIERAAMAGQSPSTDGREAHTP